MTNRTTEKYKAALEGLEELKYWLDDEVVDDEEQAEIIKEILELCETLTQSHDEDNIDDYLRGSEIPCNEDEYEEEDDY